jgi:hypothetical protein
MTTYIVNPRPVNPCQIIPHTYLHTHTSKHLSSKGGVNMSFYISHNTFITGESKIVREFGKDRKDIIKDVPPPKKPVMTNLSNNPEQTHNSNTICVNATATKNKQEFELKKNVTLTRVNTSLKEEDLKQEYITRIVTQRIIQYR